MENFIQINLNHFWVAQQLLSQIALECLSDILIISDQYSNPSDDSRWSKSADGRCVIALAGSSGLVVDGKETGDGFTWLRAGRFLVNSCYFTPRRCDERLFQFLGDLEESIALHGAEDVVLFVGGDFNAHSAEWG